ncbi:hypothetical protein F3Y22_tig00111332pilonHSYRG00062 [Hibiscus syriacus]|uniref:Uncharacterized protein n=1 Tax=Hibiscus syriacus TaxID=106335 RepID=A0A6A2YPL8_HIBSY|nr:O-acyltransferase WSD1-like [Hibiscus syriacus]KAE8681263.1 hypothetical protein F3Y22_tig00111332pilonHSYRG00062 [Hibiscus syriacus]
MELEGMSLRPTRHAGLKGIKVRKEMERPRGEEEEEEEPLSPMARMFHEPQSNVYTVSIFGFENPINPHIFKAKWLGTVARHPRFSSVQVTDEKNGGEMKWVKTRVDIDEHVKVPMIDQDMASPDKFVEDYVANLSKTQISTSIPMWDCHILNLKTSDAESTLVFRAHHSLGDGTSLVSLILSCSDTLQSSPAKKEPRSASAQWFSIRSPLLLTWNTLVDVWMCAATTYFFKDTETPLKAPSSSVAFTPRRIVRHTFSLDDVKLVKNATSTTVNDVMLAITHAGLSRYLNRKYGEAKHDNGEAREWENNLPNNIRLTATLFVNLRKSPQLYPLEEMVKKNSKGEWGNKIGYVLFPFKIGLKDNPLDYIKDAKARMDRKKATLEAKFRLFMAKVFVKFYRTKMGSFPLTTMWFSNLGGPREEISLFGNRVTSVSASLYGQPVALTIHILCYGKKISMVLSVDESIISNPYELCDDFEEALKLIKTMILKKLSNASRL